MCEPTTLTMIALTATMAGGAMSAYSGISSGYAAKAQADYASSMADRNAEIADRQAAAVQEQANAEKVNARRRLAKTQGEGRTAYAAGNVALGSGSPVDWESDIAVEEQYDENNIDYNAAMRKWELGNQAASYRSEADMYSQAGSNALTSGYLNAGGSLLSTAASSSSMAYNFWGDSAANTTSPLKTGAAASGSSGTWGVGSSPNEFIGVGAKSRSKTSFWY